MHVQGLKIAGEEEASLPVEEMCLWWARASLRAAGWPTPPPDLRASPRAAHRTSPLKDSREPKELDSLSGKPDPGKTGGG